MSGARAVELPVMTRAPELEARNATSISIKWREWRAPSFDKGAQGGDKGAGPVRSYVVYYRHAPKGGGDSAAAPDWLRLLPINMARIRAVVMGLEEGRAYQFRVAAVHQAGYEGVPSPPVLLTTCYSMTTDYSCSFAILASIIVTRVLMAV